MQIEGLQPFFIVSPGRSGSTLLRKLLMNGGQVHVPPESDAFLIQTIKAYPVRRKLSWLMQCEQLAEQYRDSALPAFWQFSPETYKEHLLETPVHLQTLYTQLWSLHDTHRKVFNSKAHLIGDKTPLHSEWAKWLHRVSPHSGFVFMTRDIREVIASRKRHFAESTKQAFLRYAYAWKAMSSFQATHPDLYLWLQYENLVCQPESELNRVCGFIGINFSDSMLSSENVPQGDTHLPHHQAVFKSLNNERLNQGRMQLSQEEIAQIRALAKRYHLPDHVFHHQSDPQ